MLKLLGVEGHSLAGQIFSRKQTITVIAIAVVAGCVPALQPLLLGGLLAAGKIDGAAIGYAATVEGLGMAIAAAAAGTFLPPRRLRVIASVAIFAVLGANLLTMTSPAAGIIAARGLSGIGNGILLWVLVGMMTRAAIPARLFAAYVTSQALVSFLLSLVFASFALPRFGVRAGYIVLTTLNALLLGIVRFAPSDYIEFDNSRRGGRMPSTRGLLALGAVMLQLAGVMAFWVYSIPLGVQAGVQTGSVQIIVGAANGAQILAGLAALALAGRVTGVQAVTLTAVASIVTLLMTTTGGSVFLWLPAMLVFAFCWMFAPPFHIPFLIAADPTQRAAMFVSTAQLVGVAVGPLLASVCINASDYGPARLVSVACFVLTVIIALITS